MSKKTWFCHCGRKRNKVGEVCKHWDGKPAKASVWLEVVDCSDWIDDEYIVELHDDKEDFIMASYAMPTKKEAKALATRLSKALGISLKEGK